jgi:D-alanyl-lipoteichoic acid acyltransferase DltB (MBOAT superfamily)
MLCYTLQIYFDFSGYSDMAIGLGWLFGIRLPINFASPYKAQSIAEYWQRWHVTLSRFLRDYVYIALGGNRHGTTRQNVNLMTTMLIGGLWHGAAWTVVLWGAMHGAMLVINRVWEQSRFGARHAMVRSRPDGDIRLCTARLRRVSRSRSRDNDGDLPRPVRVQRNVLLASDMGDR